MLGNIHMHNICQAIPDRKRAIEEVVRQVQPLESRQVLYPIGYVATKVIFAQVPAEGTAITI